MNTPGRPRKLNKLGEKFTSLILDPFRSPQMIASEMGISLRTYYRYEHELGLPTLRAAIGDPLGCPRQAALNRMRRENEPDLMTILHIGRALGVRLHLITCEFALEPERLLRKRQVDLALARKSWIKRLASEFYGSDHYIGRERPCGVLFMRKGTQVEGALKKPIIGVAQQSVHFDYASTNFRQDFEVRSVINTRVAFAKLEAGQIDAILTNHCAPKLFNIDSKNLEIRSKTYDYGTHSAILFNADSVIWREHVNEVIHCDLRANPSFQNG
jgi:hypothetical protein